MTPRQRLALAVAAAALVAFGSALAGIGVRSTYGGHAAVDEPQYLLTALSLWEDRDLDVADELAGERWRDFHDAQLPEQTAVLADGRRLSPHDPLLPLLLAVPVGLGGWVGAKAFLAVLTGTAAGLIVWIAVRRLHVSASVAGVGVALAAASPPLAVYGSQVYPELPAALAVLVAVAAALGDLRRGGLVTVAAAVVALPWLGVKYVPVAAVLAACVLWRLWREHRPRAAAWLASGLAVAGVAYLAAHRAIYGGWTVYASGDHFERTGEFAVMGVSPDYAGRTVRLVALLVDQGFGLVAWQPAWLLVPVAVAALIRRRPPGAPVLLLPALAGWATATWVALTMHGFWWPGRQLVVVLPLLLLAILHWAARLAGPVRAGCAVLGTAGVVAFAALVRDGYAGRLTWVSGFEAVANPLYGALRAVLPDYRGDHWMTGHAAWSAVLVALIAAGWHMAGRAPSQPRSSGPSPVATPFPQQTPTRKEAPL